MLGLVSSTTVDIATTWLTWAAIDQEWVGVRLAGWLRGGDVGRDEMSASQKRYLPEIKVL